MKPRMLLSFALCIIFTLSISAQNFEFTVDVSSFDEIQSKGVADVHFIISDKTEVRVTSQIDVEEYIEVEVFGESLKLDTDFPKNFWNRKKKNPKVEFFVYGPAVNKIRNSGVGSFKCDDKFETDRLHIINSGVGNVKIYDLEVETLEATADGVGNILVEGNGDEAIYRADGVGNIKAFEFMAKDVDARISGVGSIKLYAGDNLKAYASGVGNISYKGNPRLNIRDTSITSKVRKAD